MKSENRKMQNGVAALPTILLLGGLIVEIAIAASLGAYLLTSSELGIRLGAESLIAAKAGIQDGLIRVVRDKNFTSTLYTLTVGNHSADVTVCKELVNCDAGLGKHKITAVGKAQARRRKLEAVVSVDAVTGEVRLETLREVSL